MSTTETPPAGTGTGTELPVVSVIVFEDRAQVTRAGNVPPPTVRRTVTVDGVSPLIVERMIETTVSIAASSWAVS